MVTLPKTLGDPIPPNHHNVYICVVFHIFIADEHRDFRFGAQVDHSKSQPKYDKLFLKGP